MGVIVIVAARAESPIICGDVHRLAKGLLQPAGQLNERLAWFAFAAVLGMPRPTEISKTRHATRRYGWNSERRVMAASIRRGLPADESRLTRQPRFLFELPFL